MTRVLYILLGTSLGLSLGLILPAGPRDCPESCGASELCCESAGRESAILDHAIRAGSPMPCADSIEPSACLASYMDAVGCESSALRCDEIRRVASW